jgi:hypothetical protein
MQRKGNTVGSRRKLTSKQEKVLIGTLLGDGTMELNGKYPRLRIQHSQRQNEYLKWKHKVFSKISTKVKSFYRKKDCRTKKRYACCSFDTHSIHSLNGLYKIFYCSGKKKIPSNFDKILNSPLSLAVWFMDDGQKRSDCNALRISTDSFSYKEQLILQKCLYKNFNISVKIHKKGKFWNLYIPSIETRKFIQIISRYVIPSMKYKISLDPVTTDPVKER